MIEMMILMGYDYNGGGATLPHTHSTASSNGGPLSTTVTLMGAAPLFSLMVALG